MSDKAEQAIGTAKIMYETNSVWEYISAVKRPLEALMWNQIEPQKDVPLIRQPAKQETRRAEQYSDEFHHFIIGGYCSSLDRGKEP